MSYNQTTSRFLYSIDIFRQRFYNLPPQLPRIDQAEYLLQLIDYIRLVYSNIEHNQELSVSIARDLLNDVRSLFNEISFSLKEYGVTIEPLVRDFNDDPQPTQNRRMGMNYSTAIFLVNDQVRGILCSFEEDGRNYLYKTFDTEIKEGDFVAVPRNKQGWDIAVVRVEEVDVDPDFDSSHEYKWVIGVIDQADFEQITKTEDDAIEVIKKSEKLKRRKEMKKNLEDLAGEELKQVVFQPEGKSDPEIIVDGDVVDGTIDTE